MVDVFVCWCKNNLIFVGELGVGKIVFVEGFVLCVVEVSVLNVICDVCILIFDLGLL